MSVQGSHIKAVLSCSISKYTTVYLSINTIDMATNPIIFTIITLIKHVIFNVRNNKIQPLGLK